MTGRREMQHPVPQRPGDIDPLAEALLTRLQSFPAARQIVLGGYFALKHYCDYRITHDVDAWWTEESRESDREQARGALKAVLESLASDQGLTVNRRRFGDTESWELLRAGSKIFSFQIASRTLRLEPALPSPWPPLLIETFADNVASKMNALVQRGAPRDFTDIRQLIITGHLTATESWDLWKRKNPGLVPGRVPAAAPDMRLDHSVYPDLDQPPRAPADLATLEDRADYLQRVCAQWDYGIVPEPETFRLLAQWREVFDRFPLSHSAAYHTFRFWFGWEAVPGRALRASYELDDLREGRTDPCALCT